MHVLQELPAWSGLKYSFVRHHLIYYSLKAQMRAMIQPTMVHPRKIFSRTIAVEFLDFRISAMMVGNRYIMIPKKPNSHMLPG